MSDFEEAITEFRFDLHYYNNGVAVTTEEGSTNTAFRKGKNNEFDEELRGRAIGGHAYALADDPDRYVAREHAGDVLAITDGDEIIERMEIEDMATPELGIALHEQFASQETEEYGERLHELASHAAMNFSDISNEVSDWDAVQYGRFNGVESDRIAVDSDIVKLHGSKLRPDSSFDQDLQIAMYAEMMSEYEEDTDLNLEDSGQLTEIASENPEQYTDVIEAAVLGQAIGAVQGPQTEFLASMDEQISAEIQLYSR